MSFSLSLSIQRFELIKERETSINNLALSFNGGKDCTRHCSFFVSFAFSPLNSPFVLASRRYCLDPPPSFCLTPYSSDNVKDNDITVFPPTDPNYLHSTTFPFPSRRIFHFPLPIEVQLGVVCSRRQEHERKFERLDRREEI